MSHQNRLPRWLSADRLDTTLAKVGILASVLLLSLRLLTAQVLLVVIPVATGVACALYFGVHRRQATAFEFPTLPVGVGRYLPSAVFVGLAGLVLAIAAVGSRTLPIYLLIGAIGATILAQPLLIDADELSPSLVLAQILASAVVIRLSVLFITPGFIGVDIWTHVPVFIQGIVDSGSLAAIADSKYSMAPFYHTIGAVAALVFGSARIGMYLSVGLLVPLSALLIYATGALLLPARWALVATTLFVFADQVIRWGLHIIPTSLGLVFFLGALYSVTRLSLTDEPWLIGVLLAVSLATVFTHQVSTAILLVFLGIAAVSVVASRVFGSTADRVSTRSLVGIVGTFLVTLVVTIASWTVTPWYSDEPFLTEMLATLETTIASEAGFLNLAGEETAGAAGGAESVGVLADIVPFVEWFGFALLLAIAVVGGLALLRMENPPSLTGTYVLSAAAMFVVIFGFSLFGVRAILPGRWIAFMYALLAIMGAVGLFHLSGRASKRVLLVIVVVLAIGYPTSMVVAEKATLDSPALGNENPRYSYTESEIAAVGTISSIYSPDEAASVDSDHPYHTLYGRLGGYTSRTAVFDASGSTDARPVIARSYQRSGPAVFNEDGNPSQSVLAPTVSPDRVCSPARNRVYTNDEVTMCTSSSVTEGSL
ncbi:hypothetical protein EGH24_06600 [Halonotius terrestris]|uniref:Uncharacterized protein n=1 Tax=Halonotius terrestris TaxID=2487750 RepID=A0A8J8PDA0_9EURY|nr:hypothetical protein [Halonotius terrestris]TQQ83097.1 hypothetical protein EGH24_06600 [Halonotius terrestris]